MVCEHLLIDSWTTHVVHGDGGGAWWRPVTIELVVDVGDSDPRQLAVPADRLAVTRDSERPPVSRRDHDVLLRATVEVPTRQERALQCTSLSAVTADDMIIMVLAQFYRLTRLF